MRRIGTRTLAAAVITALSGLATASELIRIDGAPGAIPESLRIVERYPGFVVAEGDADALAALRAAGVDAQPLAYGYRLALPNAELAQDPQQLAPWSRFDRSVQPADELALVQFRGPTRPEWLEGLRAAGIEVVQYLHPYTYLVWNRGGLSAHAADAAEIRWLGEWPTTARLSLWDAELGRSSAPVTLRVLAFAGAGLDAEQLSGVSAMLKGRAAVGGSVEELLVELPGTQAEALAALSGVISVQDLPQDGGTRGELSNQQFVGNVGADRMANVDSGLDENHPALVNRMRPCTGTTCGGTGSSHGTHTAGIMAGDGGNNVRDAAGFLRGLGVAPGAELVEQRYSPFFQQRRAGRTTLQPLLPASRRHAAPDARIRRQRRLPVRQQLGTLGRAARLRRQHPPGRRRHPRHRSGRPRRPAAAVRAVDHERQWRHQHAGHAGRGQERADRRLHQLAGQQRRRADHLAQPVPQQRPWSGAGRPPDSARGRPRLPRRLDHAQRRPQPAVRHQHGLAACGRGHGAVRPGLPAARRPAAEPGTGQGLRGRQHGRPVRRHRCQRQPADPPTECATGVGRAARRRDDRPVARDALRRAGRALHRHRRPLATRLPSAQRQRADPAGPELDRRAGSRHLQQQHLHHPGVEQRPRRGTTTST